MSGYLGYNSLHKQTTEYKYSSSKYNGFTKYHSCNTLNSLESTTVKSSPWLDSLHRRTLRNHEFFRDSKDSHDKVTWTINDNGKYHKICKSAIRRILLKQHILRDKKYTLDKFVSRVFTSKWIANRKLHANSAFVLYDNKRMKSCFK